MPSDKILIVEDSPTAMLQITTILQNRGYDLVHAMDGEEALQKVAESNPRLIVLDVILPKKNGFQVCRQLKSVQQTQDIKILMLTSKREETDKVLGLELGADDYITKPCSLRELHARIKANLRRGELIRKEFASFSFADIEIDFKKQKAQKRGKPLQLSTKEYEILHFFVQHDDEVVSRDMLLDEVWGYDVYPTTRTVDNYILNLRKKIEIDATNPKHILTIHKSGYRFVSQPES